MMTPTERFIMSPIATTVVNLAIGAVCGMIADKILEVTVPKTNSTALKAGLIVLVGGFAYLASNLQTMRYGSDRLSGTGVNTV